MEHFITILMNRLFFVIGNAWNNKPLSELVSQPDYGAADNTLSAEYLPTYRRFTPRRHPQ